MCIFGWKNVLKNRFFSLQNRSKSVCWWFKCVFGILGGAWISFFGDVKHECSQILVYLSVHGSTFIPKKCFFFFFFLQNLSVCAALLCITVEGRAHTPEQYPEGFRGAALGEFRMLCAGQSSDAKRQKPPRPTEPPVRKAATAVQHP